MTNDIMTDLLNTIDIKISANSRSFNVDVHCYEHSSTEKIDQLPTLYTP